MMNLTLTVSLDAPDWDKEITSLAQAALTYFLAEQKVKAQENNIPILPLRILANEDFAERLLQQIKGIVVARQFIIEANIRETTLTVEMACVQAEAVSLSGRYIHTPEVLSVAWDTAQKGYPMPRTLSDENKEPQPITPAPLFDYNATWLIHDEDYTYTDTAVKQWSRPRTPSPFSTIKGYNDFDVVIHDEATGWSAAQIALDAMQVILDGKNQGNPLPWLVVCDEQDKEGNADTQPLVVSPPAGRSAFECLSEGPGEIYSGPYTIILTNLGSYRVIEFGYQVFCALSLEELREYASRHTDSVFDLNAPSWRRGNA